MGFLETIGQRRESRPQSSRPDLPHDLTWDDSARAIEPAPVPEPPRSNPTSPMIWIAVLVVVAAVGVGAWLGLRKSATQVAPPPAASADAAPAVDQAQVDKPQPKRTPAPRRGVVRSAVNDETAIDTNPYDSAAETPAPTVASGEVAPEPQRSEEHP